MHPELPLRDHRHPDTSEDRHCVGGRLLYPVLDARCPSDCLFRGVFGRNNL